MKDIKPIFRRNTLIGVGNLCKVKQAFIIASCAERSQTSLILMMKEDYR